MWFVHRNGARSAKEIHPPRLPVRKSSHTHCGTLCTSCILYIRERNARSRTSPYKSACAAMKIAGIRRHARCKCLKSYRLLHCGNEGPARMNAVHCVRSSTNHAPHFHLFYPNKAYPLHPWNDSQKQSCSLQNRFPLRIPSTLHVQPNLGFAQILSMTRPISGRRAWKSAGYMPGAFADGFCR